MVAQVVIKCINHQAMEIVADKAVFKTKTLSEIKYIVHNSGNDINVSLDCPTKLGGSTFNTVPVQQIFVI